MEVWLIVVIVVASVVVPGLVCFVIAKVQKKNTVREIRHAKRERLLTGEGWEPFVPLPYTIHHNHFMGGWLRLAHAGSQRITAFNIYRLQLRFAKEVFGSKTQPWSRTYKPAQTIYNDSASGAMVRSAIHTEHKTLYRQTGVARTTKGLIGSASDFLSLINNGRLGDDTVFFTYVVMPDGEWRFSHTGTGVLRDTISKHAVHSNAAKEVLYAGEFHVENDTLIVDNSSGTFAPRKEDLPLIVELLQKNLVGLSIDAWDWNDTRLKDAIAACPSRAGNAPPPASTSPKNNSDKDAEVNVPPAVPPFVLPKDAPPAEQAAQEPVPGPAPKSFRHAASCPLSPIIKTPTEVPA